ncbi:hypothetical protein ACIPVB_08980 [Microbacterium sp. NPDC090007]|uniref:hypothetical protein n=1 Tax=Microbacterium sp. NPDC090007 TaxID=3364204 RepID=UPI00382A9A26
MALDGTSIGELISKHSQDMRAEWGRLATLKKRIEGKLTRTWMPSDADAEYRDLFRKASSPWLEFVCDAIAQGLQVDGYSSERVWAEGWQANGMDGRQGAVNREVIGLGKSFGMSLPADGDGVVMRPLSALRTYAKFARPWDEYPEWVLTRVGRQGVSFWESEWLFIDGEAAYWWTGSALAPVDVTVDEHGLDFCPVVQLSNTLDLQGNPKSSVEAAVPIYQRVVDATFTLQMVQRYGAFPQKWMAGGEIATDANGNPHLKSSVDGLIHASGESGESARFGTFAPADLDKVVAAVDAHIKHLSAVCQVPPHYLLGAVVNMSAEGIAAAESGYFRNVADRQMSIGEGYEQWMRTAAAILDDAEAAQATSSQVHWADVSTRSLGQISDAVLKLATVGAPLELLFAMVPGWSKTDVLEAADYVRSRQPEVAAIRTAAAAAVPGTSAGQIAAQ